METEQNFENYPVGIVILSNLVSLAVYGLGIFIIYQSGWYFALLFLCYILILEIRLIMKHCTKCFYWGRTCAFGKGRISALFFKKGDPSMFCSKNMTWKDMIPDVLVSLIPFVAGIVLLILKFDLVLLIAIVVLVLLSTYGNSFIRRSFACRFCSQRILGCPAEMLFKKQE